MAFRIVEQPNQTRAVMPDDDQLRQLVGIVLDRHPWLGATNRDEAFTLADFRTAFVAQGRFFRAHVTDQSRFFFSWVARATELVDHEVHGGAFLAACLAAGDVKWQRNDPASGACSKSACPNFRARLARTAGARFWLARRCSRLSPVLYQASRPATRRG